MKKFNLYKPTVGSIFALLATSLLLQSCYSYKTINPVCSYIVVGNKYEIQQLDKVEQGKVKSITDSTINLIKGGNENQIFRRNILSIKEKQLSAGKTIALVTPISTLTLLFLFLSILF